MEPSPFYARIVSAGILHPYGSANHALSRPEQMKEEAPWKAQESSTVQQGGQVFLCIAQELYKLSYKVNLAYWLLQEGSLIDMLPSLKCNLMWERVDDYDLRKLAQRYDTKVVRVTMGDQMLHISITGKLSAAALATASDLRNPLAQTKASVHFEVLQWEPTFLETSS